MKATVTRNRARISILSELLMFPTISQKHWRADVSGTEVHSGDLISLCSAPDSKWYVSWVNRIDTNKGNPRYLLESIEDGDLCWWSNVGINVYSRQRVSERPMWRWSDAQFSFYDRWMKVGRRNDAYIVLPVLPTFGDEKSVTLDVRIRHSFNDFRNPKAFADWTKLSMKIMDVYYKESVEKYDALCRMNKQEPKQ